MGVTTLITATASQYYHFTNWTGSVSSTANPLALWMNGPKAVTANFTDDTTLFSPVPVPHWWLAQYGFTNNFEVAATNDTDGDSQPNWAEYIAGTDPTHAASVLHITNFSSNNVTFTPAFSNRNYTLWGATNLLSTNWTQLSAYQPGTGTVMRISTSTNTPQMFYRVGVQMP